MSAKNIITVFEKLSVDRRNDFQNTFLKRFSVLDLASFFLQRTPGCAGGTSRPADRGPFESQGQPGKNDSGNHLDVVSRIISAQKQPKI